ncbi:hypothetical protein [Candidatus Laterigemmans baculatus]|uniref:hypothetical protein n=1 Tax=Candidatus Laterigemmans baculatus TaxID=2770505 RepID=UPI0013D97F9E|nr:hypothetical protein [Candidatus Laterigemmans baculatus]
MRTFVLFLAAAALTAGVAASQDRVVKEGATAESTKAVRTFMVRFTEVRLDAAPDPSLTADEVVKLLTEPADDKAPDDKAPEVVEMVRLSVLERNPTMVQFGRSAAVTTGQSFSGRDRPPVRQTQMMQVGTAVHVLATPQDDKVLLETTYESSRFDGEGTADGPPEIATVQIAGRLLLEPGKPTLVGGTSAKSGTYLLVIIEE